VQSKDTIILSYRQDLQKAICKYDNSNESYHIS